MAQIPPQAVDPAAAVVAAAEAALPIARQVEQRIATKAQELAVRVQSGRLSPGDALLNLQRSAEKIARDAGAAPGVSQQDRQAARRSARRAVEQAGQALRSARGAVQRPGAGGASAASVEQLLPVAVGAGVGGLVGVATGKGAVAGVLVGGVLGFVGGMIRSRLQQVQQGGQRR
jgi:hypothetical protein